MGSAKLGILFTLGLTVLVGPLAAPSSALNTTVMGALGDLDGDGDNGTGEAAILNTAVNCWDARITTNRNFALTVSSSPLMNARGTGGTSTIVGGIPTAGQITMDNDGSTPWWIDASPLDSLEFTPDPNAQWRFINGTAASGANQADLLRSVAHEIGHALGWICGSSCNRNPDNLNYDALMNPQPANFMAGTTVNLVAVPGFNVPLRGDGVAGGIGVGGPLNELSHTGPTGPFNAVADLMFGRTGNGIRETPSMNNVDMFVRAHGDTANFPPTVSAGADRVEECTETGGSTLSLDGTGSSDPDGDQLTYSWTCANVALSDANTPTPDGFFPKGVFERCRLDATDLAACSPDGDGVDVLVVDTTKPVVTAPDDVVAECSGPAGTPVNLGNATAVDVCDAFAPVTNDAPGVFPLGMTGVTWSATDDDGNTGTDLQVVSVVDTTPPQLEVSLDTQSLWPPNHKLNTIEATVTASDVCDAAPAVRLVSITSNEPDNGRGDGNTVNDIQQAALGTPDTRFDLRSERSGRGSGRVYTIIYEAEDGSGNTTQVETTVEVAKSQGKGI